MQLISITDRAWETHTWETHTWETHTWETHTWETHTWETHTNVTASTNGELAALGVALPGGRGSVLGSGSV